MTKLGNEPQEPAAQTEALPSIDLMGVQIHAITEERCIRHILGAISAGRGGWVATPNLDHLRRFQKDPEFAKIYPTASLRVADGVPLLWASRLQGTPLPEQVAGSNMISSLSAAAASEGASVFLLGGDPGTAEKAAKVLTERFPALKIAGTACPQPGFERDESQMSELQAQLTASQADIVFVALGSPKQEVLIHDHHGILPKSWWLGVGISFSFLCGEVQRAPRWMQRCGVEWLHRLLQEPRRLMKRYLLQGIPFALRLFSRSFWRRITRQ
ncbi:MAG: WecB/TagA/CpsF family glycosyltransferase [Planctomycetota bacterium]|jgi:N-acetylglucosaminyldiphosphoundecaprenol N-acetyl-beta-D-mannosaminyltransferase